LLDAGSEVTIVVVNLVNTHELEIFRERLVSVAILSCPLESSDSDKLISLISYFKSHREIVLIKFDKCTIGLRLACGIDVNRKVLDSIFSIVVNVKSVLAIRLYSLINLLLESSRRIFHVINLVKAAKT
jgi:hypothetical protein